MIIDDSKYKVYPTVYGYLNRINRTGNIHNTDFSGYNLLMRLVDYDIETFEELAKTLIENGIGVDSVNSVGNTALYIASGRSNNGSEWVKFLLENKANPNMTKNDTKKTPIFNAVDNGRYESVKLLLNFGADLSLVDKDGKDVFSYVGDNEDIENLLNKFKKVESVEDMGW